jgi:hypothetical protein
MSEKRCTVIVWGEPQEVIVRKVSKSRWVATGEYIGEAKQTKDATESAALKRWREWAEYKGNDGLDRDLVDCAHYLLRLTSSHGPNVLQQIDVCIEEYLIRSRKPTEARARLAAAFETLLSAIRTNHVIEYARKKLTSEPST